MPEIVLPKQLVVSVPERVRHAAIDIITACPDDLTPIEILGALAVAAGTVMREFHLKPGVFTGTIDQTITTFNAQVRRMATK